MFEETAIILEVSGAEVREMIEKYLNESLFDGKIQVYEFEAVNTDTFEVRCQLRSAKPAAVNGKKEVVVAEKKTPKKELEKEECPYCGKMVKLLKLHKNRNHHEEVMREYEQEQELLAT